ncbi:MAG: hypothetical protein J6S67_16685 [Methanobrevibacter sp.]|nr:hypothetical protein [Methanobrevibacter sp.]
MRMMHNFMFDVNENFTFAEVLEELNFSLALNPFSSDALSSYMKTANLLKEEDDAWENIFDWAFVNVSEEGDLIKSNAIAILNKVYIRYQEHYCLELKIPFTEEEKAKKCAEVFRKILQICDYTYAKYSSLIEMYKSEETHLLDKLGRTRSGNRSVSQSGQNAQNSVNIFNDTPQTTDVVATMEQDQYVSELNKSSLAGSSASNGSDTYQEAENWDNETIMSRLDEIERKFAMIWRSWLNEFDQLFVEEVNY